MCSKPKAPRYTLQHMYIKRRSYTRQSRETCYHHSLHSSHATLIPFPTRAPGRAPGPAAQRPSRTRRQAATPHSSHTRSSPTHSFWRRSAKVPYRKTHCDHCMHHVRAQPSRRRASPPEVVYNARQAFYTRTGREDGWLATEEIMDSSIRTRGHAATTLEPPHCQTSSRVGRGQRQHIPRECTESLLLGRGGGIATRE